MTTDTPEACQALCAENKACGEFQWIKVGSNATTGAALKHHQCIFHCQGTNNPGSAQCVLGIKENAPFSEAVCGPQRNNSNAPPPPPAPPSPPAPSPLFPCPVPFGLSSGVLEEGTDHARADGIQGSIHELLCNPWCLFNLTSDIGERSDLGANPAYQDIAQKMADRLKYHGSTGPMPAYIWDPAGPTFKEKQNDACLQSVKSGFIE